MMVYNIFESIIDVYLHKHFINFLAKYKAVNDNYNNNGDLNNDIECWQCKYLMFSDCYGECSKGNISGIVQPHFSCGKGVIRNVDKSKD